MKRDDNPHAAGSRREFLKLSTVVALGVIPLEQGIGAEPATGLKPRTFDIALLRKISFGGLYLEPVAYPTEGIFRLDRHSIRVW